MLTRPFGGSAGKVSAVGFGAMALSLRGRPSEDAAVALLHQVLDLGVTFIDTADTYCLGPGELHHNERLIAKALAGRQNGVVVATKGGTVRTTTGWEIDGHPDRLYRSVCDSHAALGGDKPIALWQHHWPDPRYTIEEMLRPIRRAQAAGLVQHVGVGNYTLDQLKQACDFMPIDSIQNHYNPWRRAAETDGLLEYCVRQGIVFLPWRPLGGSGLSERLNQVPAVAELAKRHAVSPQRLIIAWHLHQLPCLLPIPGSIRLEHVADCIAATQLRLNEQEMAVLNGLEPHELPERERKAAWTVHPPLAQPKSSY